MSWFKRRSDSKASQRSSDTCSLNSEGMTVEQRSRCDTDPETCLEVFRNHWEQAYLVISRDANNGSTSSPDEIEAVRQNFEQMVTLLADEEGEDGQGMPGPILHYLLEHEILEKFCGWCHRNNNNSSSKLTREQLRMFEHLISQSRQLLLIHKPVIRPLLNLLAYCSDEVENSEIEVSLVLVLHQICISISKEKVILESFFNMNADHGVTKFLIFSLLIPFLHRKGTIGQQARDALLLIMALSSKHPYIGEYIAENSDFCPVLATGLSGLYSDLPRKIEIPSEDWFQITDDDVLNMTEMAMFLNSLEFCNAVAQIAHPYVRDQLIKYIYNGFLVPVLGPALHQDVSGLPTPLLDSPMFSNSREEVITATAYLGLFLRKITEPALIKAFLKFIFTEKNDEIVILDSLITRINSSSKLSLVSLSLFYTLVDLNCEDVMFDLVFKHLIPCTHVMVSQRRAVRDQDIYGKSVEKFMSLRPTCCLPEIDSPKHNLGKVPGLPVISDNPSVPTNHFNNRGFSQKFFGRGKQKAKQPKVVVHSEAVEEEIKTAFPAGSFGSKLDHFETSYLEYLHDAHIRLQKCANACRIWLYPYDGTKPPATILDSFSVSQQNGVVFDESSNMTELTEDGKGDVTNSSSVFETPVSDVAKSVSEPPCDISADATDMLKGTGAIDVTDDDIPDRDDVARDRVSVNVMTEDEFLSFLDESESPVDKSFNIDESVKSLESILSGLSSKSISKTSTPRKSTSSEEMRELTEDLLENGDLSSVYFDCETTRNICDSDFKSANETSFELIGDSSEKSKTRNVTEFEIVDSQTGVADVKHGTKQGTDSTSFLNISDIEDSGAKGDRSFDEIRVSHDKKEDSIEKERVENFFPAGDGDSVRKSSLKSDNERKSLRGDKSVRFAASTSSNAVVLEPSINVGFTMTKQSSKSPNVGPFLTAVLLKLESMMQNSLMVNLVLTGLISRLAAYPQPLLRSYLLNQTLVFQPTVKSLVQVLTLVRQKVDHYSYTVQNFEALLLRARRTLAQREGLLPERGHSLTPSPEMVHTKLRTATVSDLPSKERRHRTLSQLLFRRPMADKKPVMPSPSSNSKPGKVELLTGNKGIRFVNRRPEVKREQIGETTKTRHAVYCAIVLEEFVKELAALTQEHAVLHLDWDACCSF